MTENFPKLLFSARHLIFLSSDCDISFPHVLPLLLLAPHNRCPSLIAASIQSKKESVTGLTLMILLLSTSQPSVASSFCNSGPALLFNLVGTCCLHHWPRSAVIFQPRSSLVTLKALGPSLHRCHHRGSHVTSSSSLWLDQSFPSVSTVALCKATAIRHLRCRSTRFPYLAVDLSTDIATTIASSIVALQLSKHSNRCSVSSVVETTKRVAASPIGSLLLLSDLQASAPFSSREVTARALPSSSFPGFL
ncbi:hypothetical protein BHE74_00039897 [Ensete ventricosum]|nr:hypothetical protein BHE74_00039897 [Ensete ventricosum]